MGREGFGYGEVTEGNQAMVKLSNFSNFSQNFPTFLDKVNCYGLNQNVSRLFSLQTEIMQFSVLAHILLNLLSSNFLDFLSSIGKGVKPRLLMKTQEGGGGGVKQ